MRAATGSQCKDTKRGVTCPLLGSLKTSRSTAFWIICRGLIVFDGSPARRALQLSSLEMTRAWTRSCAACSVRKGLIFLMLCSANLQDRAVFAMCSLKVSWSSKITPRFLTEFDGEIVDEPNWIVKSCCRVGVAGKTRSSVFARLSCRMMFFHPCRDVRQAAWDPCSYRWIIWSKWEIELCVISIEMVGEAMCLYNGSQWCSVYGEEEGSKNRSLGNPLFNNMQ